MTTLHMEVEQARAIQAKLIQLHDSISRIISHTNNTVMGLPPQWRGASAEQFFELYSDSSSIISGVAGELGEIAAELAEEIEAWESVADKFSK